MTLEITSTGCYVVTHRVLMRREVRGRREVGRREVIRTSPGTQTTRRLVRVPWRSIRLIWHIHQSLHCRMLSLWKISQGRVHCQDHRKIYMRVKIIEINFAFHVLILFILTNCNVNGMTVRKNISELMVFNFIL